jgi:hypothetical protein
MHSGLLIGYLTVAGREMGFWVVIFESVKGLTVTQHLFIYLFIYLYFNSIDPEGLKKPLDMEQVCT